VFQTFINIAQNQEICQKDKQRHKPSSYIALLIDWCNDLLADMPFACSHWFDDDVKYHNQVMVLGLKMKVIDFTIVVTQYLLEESFLFKNKNNSKTFPNYFSFKVCVVCAILVVLAVLCEPVWHGAIKP